MFLFDFQMPGCPLWQVPAFISLGPGVSTDVVQGDSTSLDINSKEKSIFFYPAHSANKFRFFLPFKYRWTHNCSVIFKNQFQVKWLVCHILKLPKPGIILNPSNLLSTIRTGILAGSMSSILSSMVPIPWLIK